jgi:hypothetical protein
VLCAGKTVGFNSFNKELKVTCGVAATLSISQLEVKLVQEATVTKCLLNSSTT